MHLYLPTGEKPSGKTLYEVPNKSKGGMRPANVRDAKEYGAGPGVTEVGKNLDLADWRGQMMIEALKEWYKTNSHVPTYKEIKPLYYEKMSEAREFGTAVHDKLEQYMRNAGLVSFDEDRIRTCTMPAIQWLHDNVEEVKAVEHPFYHLGYGGKIDLIAKIRDLWYVIDYKTQGLKGKSFKTYDNYIQLAAYQDAASFEFELDLRVGNLMINSDPSNPKVEFIDHTAKLDQGFAEFMSMYLMWCLQKDFMPPNFAMEVILQAISEHPLLKG